jgi:hypothetical protein
MALRRELQSKLELIEELQRRIENREDGFQFFATETTPTEELDDPPDVFGIDRIKPLARLAEFFANCDVEKVMALSDELRVQFVNLLNRSIDLLEDARHYDMFNAIASAKAIDRASFVQAANEIYEDISEDLNALKPNLEIRPAT